MSLPIYQRVAVTDAGDVIPGAEYTVVNENTGVAAPIYSDRSGATLLTAPYFADSAGTIQFFIAQGTTFRVAASGGVGTYTDRYVYGVAGAVLVQADGSAIVDRVGSDGAIVYYRKDGATIGTAGVDGGDLTISSAATNHAGLRFANSAVLPVRDGAVNAGEVSLGQASGNYGFKDLYLSGTAYVGGNVGIGTNSPSAKIEINGSTSTDGVLIKNPISGSFYNAKLEFARDGTLGGAKIQTERSSSGGVGLGFNVTSSNTAELNGTYSEAMRVDNAGNLLVGKTATTIANAGCSFSPSGSNMVRSGGTLLDMNRQGSDGNIIAFYNDGSLKGTISVNGTSTAYNTSSDYRLKEDDVAMTGATERVKALRPINFAWKVDGSRVDGFFAHELAEVVPEAATGTKDAMIDEEYEVTPAVYEDVITPAVEAAEAVFDEDGVVITEAVEAIAETTESVLVTEAAMDTRSVPDYQGIDQSKLVPLLTATIQELIARIEALESGA